MLKIRWLWLYITMFNIHLSQTILRCEAIHFHNCKLKFQLAKLESIIKWF